MRRCGAVCSPEEFQAAVNVTFHGFESEVYDEIHQDMWRSLPPIFDLFAGDCLASAQLPDALAMLDIGCGTGLASDSILKSRLGPRVRSIDLLDTSPKMLARATERSRKWGVPVRTYEGILDSIPDSNRYDLIVTCSVLHHVPDIPGFVNNVARLQPAGGIFLHLQDPNADAAADPEFRKRCAMVSKSVPEWLARLAPRRIAGRIWRELTGHQGDDYISKTNRELLGRSVIARPLTAAELFSITDIHIHDQQGISVSRLKDLMPSYTLISQRTYGFFGILRSSLPASLQSQEDAWIVEGALNGGHVGAAWLRR